MAAPSKQGLDYFPFPVDFFDNEIIGGISGMFGIKGEIVVVKLLCTVYRKGYFAVWSDLLQSKIANDASVSKDLANQVVDRLVAWGFFNEDLYSSAKVLTSVNIQQTYLEATKRRKNRGKMPYLINEDNNNGSNEVNVNINPNSKGVNDDINAQSKVNETKVNKNKVNNNQDDNPFIPLFQMYQQEFGIMSPTAKQQVFDSVSDFTKGGATDQQASEIIQYAISIAVSYNKRYWNYTSKILDDWVNHSLFDLDNIKAYQNKPHNPKGSYKNFNHKPKEQATDWDKLKAKEPLDNSSNLQDRLKKLRDEENATK